MGGAEGLWVGLGIAALVGGVGDSGLWWVGLGGLVFGG